MIETKTFEVRDSMTMMPVIGMKITAETSERPDRLLRHVGYGTDPFYVLIHVGSLDEYPKLMTSSDYFKEEGTTMRTAFDIMVTEWDTLSDGAILQAGYVSGRTEIQSSGIEEF